MYNTDGLEPAATSSVKGRYALRLGRAVFLLALGAIMHLPAPGGPSVSTPLVSPLQFVRLEALRAAYEPPSIIVEESIVYVGNTAQPAVLEASNTETDALPVGTSGFAEGTPMVAEFRPLGALDAPPLGLPPVDLSAIIELPSSVPIAPTPVTAEKDAVVAMTSGPTVRDEPMDPLVAPAVRVRAPDAAIALKPVALAERRAREEALVRRLIDEYTEAYDRLDVGAAQAVWPTVDGKALKKAFEQLTSQRLTMESCGITISGSTANARCRGSHTYQPRIGSRSGQIASREWTFDLSKKDTDWRIVNTFVR